MSEADTISQAQLPRTRQSLTADLLNAGVTGRMRAIAHSSLSSLGWVCGGAVTVVQALMDVLTPTGTLVMPTHSTDYSDPTHWQNPPVPSQWWQTIRDTMPAYNPQVTPTREMGKIVEVFRTYENVVRSSHPSFSFAAWGLNADTIIQNHSLDYPLGEKSPLAQLYNLKASVLLLGVGYDSCTCFHLAQYRVGTKQIERGAPILEAGKRVWKRYTDIELDTDCFIKIGAEFEQAGYVKISRVGSAQTKLFAVKDAVDFAVDWLNKNK